MKENELNSFSLEDKKLLKKYIEEYNDIYQNIFKLSGFQFIKNLRKRVEISLKSKINNVPLTARAKIEEYIKKNIYSIDYKFALIIKKTIKERTTSEKIMNYFNGNILPHCDKDKKYGYYIHTCGEKFQIFEYHPLNYIEDSGIKNNNKNDYILYCEKCDMIYKSNLIKFKCNNSNIDFYSKIIDYKDENDSNLIKENVYFATWKKYHCNAIINDTMKCHNCNEAFIFYPKKNILFCHKCNIDINPNDIIWTCIICREKFISDAKIYNSLEFKPFKMAIKDALINQIPAKPEKLQCDCKINLNEVKFFHKVGCFGELYLSELNSKTVIVCSKCEALGLYKGYLWTCPICLKKFKIKYNNCNLTNNSLKKENFFINRRETLGFKVSLYEKYNKEAISKESCLCEGFNKNINVFKSNANSSKILNEIKITDFEDSGNFTNETLKNNYIFFHNSTKRKFLRNSELNYGNTFFTNVLNMEKTPKQIENLCSKSGNGSNSKLRKELLNYEDLNNSISPYKSDKDSIDLNGHIKKSLSIITEKNNNSYLKFSMAGENDFKMKKTLHNQSNPLINSLTNFNEKKKDNLILEKFGEREILKPITKLNKSIKNNTKEGLMINYKSNENPKIDNIKNVLLNQKNVYTKKNNIQKNTIFNYAKIKPDEKKNININMNLNNIIITNSIIDNAQIQNYQTNFVNDYIIIKQIGEGTFGQIFLVKNRNSENFALKKLIAKNYKDLKKLLHEYQIIIDLQKTNPELNLVKIYGLETKQLDPTTYVIYVLMELAKRDWEKDILNRQKFKLYYSESELISIIKNLISTFSFLQQENICHRDIKPQNVLIFETKKNKYSYKLSDFGEAKELNDDSATNRRTLRGTELYMSPILFYALRSREIMKYVKHNPYKSDLFSFGLCILFAATLTFDSLYDIRELKSNTAIKIIVEKYLSGRYSVRFINMILLMLDLNELTRNDFISLEKEIDDIF